MVCFQLQKGRLWRRLFLAPSGEVGPVKSRLARIIIRILFPLTSFEIPSIPPLSLILVYNSLRSSVSLYTSFDPEGRYALRLRLVRAGSWAVGGPFGVEKLPAPLSAWFRGKSCCVAIRNCLFFGSLKTGICWAGGLYTWADLMCRRFCKRMGRYLSAPKTVRFRLFSHRDLSKLESSTWIFLYECVPESRGAIPECISIHANRILAKFRAVHSVVEIIFTQDR